MDLLKANPFIQRLVEERVTLLEARMKSELSQGNSLNIKTSECYNITDTPSASAHLRWPNESSAEATRKRTAFSWPICGRLPH